MDEVGDEPLHPAVARILREHDAEGLLSVLGDRMSGSDLTTLLLEVVRRRAATVTAGEVMGQYERDRFVQPAAIDPRRLLELEVLALDVVSPRFEPIATSPLAPIGAHSVVAGVHQHRVVTTVRGTEVAADPTNSLALEAARRRRGLLASDARSAEPVRLASVDRVVRAQRFGGPRSFAHFTLLGLVSAGRDVGSHAFESASMGEHLVALTDVLDRLGVGHVSVRLSDFGMRHQDVLDALVDSVSRDGVDVSIWPERTAARGYYPNVCFKLDVLVDGEMVEVADGGVVTWTQDLVASRKERLTISGLSLERLAASTAWSERGDRRDR